MTASFDSNCEIAEAFDSDLGITGAAIIDELSLQGSSSKKKF
jgi:hypothetical protein